MLKKSLLLFAVLLSLNLATAGIMHCRSGIVLAAEVTFANIKINNFTGAGFQLPPASSRAYAVVTIKPNDMRAFSIFDYSLQLSGVTFPCVAIWNKNAFEYTVNDIKGSGNIQLLFILDRNMIIDQNKIDIMLNSNLSNVKDIYTSEVPFKVIGTRTPTLPNRVSAAGMLELKIK